MDREKGGLRRKWGGLGTVCMALGILLIGAALGLALYNRWDEQRAAAALEPLLSQLRTETVTVAPGEPRIPETAAPELSKLPSVHEPGFFTAGVPAEIQEADQRLPAVTIDGVAYIGIVTIPSLGLELPVCSQCDETKLRNSPCRYAGERENLVIAGHNYICHFGYLNRLRPGDQVLFTTVEGAVCDYQVEVLETLESTDVEDMTDGDWPLTLFTCTMGRQYRLTVRCSRTT